MSTQPAPTHDQIRMGWQKDGVALLPLGTLFSAIRLPVRLVLAVAGDHEAPSRDLDEFLTGALDGGPVICDPHGHRYYALVPATMPATWHQAADDWRALGVDCLGCDTYLGVPRLDLIQPDPQTYASYWSVPMPAAAMLCAPLAVARLIAAGRRRLPEEPDA